MAQQSGNGGKIPDACIIQDRASVSCDNTALPTDHIMPHHLQSNGEESHTPHQIVSSKGIIYSREPFHFAKLNLELAEY